MSCSNSLVFKIGDTFNVPIIFQQNETPIEILPNMSFTAVIANIKGEIIVNPTVTPDSNQVDNKGYLYITVDDTSSWVEGTYIMEIKYLFNGTVKTSQQMQFKVVKGIQ